MCAGEVLVTANNPKAATTNNIPTTVNSKTMEILKSLQFSNNRGDQLISKGKGTTQRTSGKSSSHNSGYGMDTRQRYENSGEIEIESEEEPSPIT